MTLTTPYFHQIFYKYPTDKHSLPWARRAHRHIATYTRPPIVGRIYPILMYSPIDIYPPNCWHDIYNTNTYIQLRKHSRARDTHQLPHTPLIVGRIYPISIYSPTDTHSPIVSMIYLYIQYVGGGECRGW